ncbi:MAG: YfiR family protein [Acidobacteriaceae bacterium]
MELTAGPGRGNARARRLRWWLGGWLLAVAGAASAGLPAQNARAQRPSRDDVEAAYLYNFGKFVRWPSSSTQGPLVICVAAQDSLSQALSGLVTGEQIDQRPLQVKAVDNPGAVAGCSILFIGPTDPGRLNALLTAAAGKPILTVGDAPDFLVRGGAIQFVQMEDHVRFSVNLGAAGHSGLGLSSELLKVAVSVTGRPGTGGEP